MNIDDRYMYVGKRIMIREVVNGYVIQNVVAFGEIPDEYAAESIDTVLEIVKKLLEMDKEE